MHWIRKQDKHHISSNNELHQLELEDFVRLVFCLLLQSVCVSFEQPFQYLGEQLKGNELECQMSASQ